MKLKSIKRVDDCDLKCINVENPDGLYVTDDHIVTHNSVIQTANGLNWKVMSSANSLLGLNLLIGAMTELTFFKEAGKGWTDAKILEFFSKLNGRIVSRFGNNYMARTIIDSSVSNTEDPIQEWIDKGSKDDNTIYRLTGSRWRLFPKDFPGVVTVVDPTAPISKREVIVKPDWNTSFKMYKGGSGKLPQYFENEEATSGFVDADLIWVPRFQYAKSGVTDMLNLAKKGPAQFLQDYCSIAVGQVDRLLYRGEWVEGCFDNGLRNIYGAIQASADLPPEHLIWNQIQDKFFNTILGSTRFYIDPSIPRVVSVDQSKSKDCTCISMSHCERDPNFIDSETGKLLPVYVTDFTIMIIPVGGHISLDAIKFFIHDLRTLGRLNIKYVSFDTFQSDAQIQWLRRDGFEVEQVSADKDANVYYTFLDLIKQGRWHCGKNIFIKNNLLSLHERHRERTGSVKVDHFEGELTYTWTPDDWFYGKAGYNAKDGTDACCENIALMVTHADEFAPIKEWNKNVNYNISPREAARQSTGAFANLGVVTSPVNANVNKKNIFAGTGIYR